MSNVWLKKAALTLLLMFILPSLGASVVMCLEALFVNITLVCQTLLVVFSSIGVWLAVVLTMYRLYAIKLNAPRLAQASVKGLK